MRKQNLIDNRYSFEVSPDSNDPPHEYLKKVLIGNILWSIHRKQGTEACLVQAIEPYLSREDRALFGLV